MAIKVYVFLLIAFIGYQSTLGRKENTDACIADECSCCKSQDSEESNSSSEKPPSDSNSNASDPPVDESGGTGFVNFILSIPVLGMLFAPIYQGFESLLVYTHDFRYGETYRK